MLMRQILMDHHPVGSLANVLNVVDKPFSEEQIAVVLSAILKGLAFLHNVSVPHRFLFRFIIHLNHSKGFTN